MTRIDVSSTSMLILEEKCSVLFASDVWIPDWIESRERISNGEKNILLMGSFFERIFQFTYWPDNSFHLFCFSQSVKNILVKMFLFESNTIEVIPRYKLFPICTTLLPFLNESPFTLVHAGRISPQKNIEFIILINFYFQILVSPDIKLSLMGKFDNEFHHDVLNINFLDYQKKIIHLINSLPWPGEKPVIQSHFKSYEWCSHFPPNGVLISASTLVSEDFSVSAAQAQENGFPILAPYWGGFQDLKGDNVRLFDHKLIGTSYNSFKDISEKAKNFVLKYLDQNIFHTPSNAIIFQNTVTPRAIDKDYLKKKYNDNILKWGKEIGHIADENFPLFAKSENGQKFFREYYFHFSN